MIDSSLLRELFLQGFPANVQMILTSADSMTLDKLAEMADRIMERLHPRLVPSAHPQKAETCGK